MLFIHEIPAHCLHPSSSSFATTAGGAPAPAARQWNGVDPMSPTYPATASAGAGGATGGEKFNLGLDGDENGSDLNRVNSMSSLSWAAAAAAAVVVAAAAPPHNAAPHHALNPRNNTLQQPQQERSNPRQQQQQQQQSEQHLLEAQQNARAEAREFILRTDSYERDLASASAAAAAAGGCVPNFNFNPAAPSDAMGGLDDHSTGAGADGMSGIINKNNYLGRSVLLGPASTSAAPVTGGAAASLNLQQHLLMGMSPRMSPRSNMIVNNGRTDSPGGASIGELSVDSVGFTFPKLSFLDFALGGAGPSAALV